MRRVLSPLTLWVQSLRPEIEAVAGASGIPASALEKEVALQLPRLFPSPGREVECALVGACSQYLKSVWGDAAEFCGPARVRELREMHFEEVSDEHARPIFGRLHYLHSHRSDGRHFGLLSDNRIAALASVSPFDLRHLESALGNTTEREPVLVVSRIFVLPWAPKNSISYLLSRVAAEARRRSPSVRMLITYLDPNVGFSGAAYRAANWKLLARERTAGYLYLDGWHATIRELHALTHVLSFPEMKRIFGARLERSLMELDPLEVYGLRLTANAELHKSEVPVVESPV